MGYIYKITNKENGQGYIGQTSRSYKDRWAEHKRDRFKEPYCNWPLYKMINKVGIENINWETIGRSLVSIGALLLEISIFANLAGKAKHVISTGLSLILVASGLKILASVVNDFSGMILYQRIFIKKERF